MHADDENKPMDILSQVSWQEVGGAIVSLIAILTGGIVANDRIKIRRQRMRDLATSQQAATVLQRECDRRHNDLDRLIDEKHKGLEIRIDEVKIELNRGFDRMEKAIEKRRT